MMRLSLLFGWAVMFGCGGDDDAATGIHSLTTCDNSTTNAGMPCERGCATHHDETAIACSAHSDVPSPDGTDVSCPGTFGLDGVIGCCVVLPDTIVLRFVECE
jgi:hypothetical protein